MIIIRSLGIPIVFLCLSLDLAFCQETPQQPLSPFAGKRAILDGDIPHWTNKEYVDHALTRIKKAGFNVYMPTVWQGRGTAWPSKYAPWDTKLADRPKIDFDPLRYLIQEAHKLGIEVHPWFTLTLRQSNIFPEFALPGMPEKAFDVHNPQFRELMSKLVDEVVSDYDVDGVNLDYVRAIGVCSSVTCQEEYKKKYNRSLEADSLQFKVLPGTVASMIEYQETAVTSLVRKISETVKKKKPHVLISADVFVGHAPLNQGQSSIHWVNDGLLDVIFRMDYFRRINIESMDATRRELNNPNRQSLLISNMSNPDEQRFGQKPFARDGKWLVDTISTVFKRWPGTGIAVYFYKYLTDEQILALKNGPFQNHDIPPPVPQNLSIK
ncbi:MAG TPA: family 10 glycosylhydrolase [Nitrospiraceae bacterium]|nr:family 10 glycosylhydrolase [Nitrospiraceae bacterium]